MEERRKKTFDAIGFGQQWHRRMKHYTFLYDEEHFFEGKSVYQSKMCMKKDKLHEGEGKKTN